MLTSGLFALGVSVNSLGAYSKLFCDECLDMQRWLFLDAESPAWIAQQAELDGETKPLIFRHVARLAGLRVRRLYAGRRASHRKCMDEF